MYFCFIHGPINITRTIMIANIINIIDNVIFDFFLLDPLTVILSMMLYNYMIYFF